MGLGYVIGCFLSIALWKLNRRKVFLNITKKLNNLIKNCILCQVVYLFIIVLICFLINLIFKYHSNWTELYNLITVFLCVNISSTEKENIERHDKIYFYNSISEISYSLVCSFISPFVYIFFLGNAFAVFAAFVFYSGSNKKFKIFNLMSTLLSIIPSLFAEIYMYICCIIKNNSLKVGFEGDYFKNLISNPLLNVDILAAYAESVKFYYYYRDKDTDYIKSYGEYKNKIDTDCIRDYLGTSYIVCIITFSVFYIFINLKL